VLSNLLGNAAKFTSNGRISLVAARSDTTFTISVRDTGPGIDARRVATLFEKFDSDETARDNGQQGTGLGLALSRRLCRLMGGDLTVESEHGRFACFTICLPVTIRAQPAAAGAAGADHEHADAVGGERTVLVIDDDPNVLYVLQGSLSRLGYTVIVAADGFEGIELARETRPSLILLDVNMPGPTGWQVLKAIRSDKALKRCPVVMLTVDDDVQRGRATGANATMRKPLDPAQLQRLLAQVLLDGGADASPSPQHDAALAA
jgi:adenylate cyclase